MKKILALLATVIAVVSLVNCGNGGDRPPAPTDVAVVPHDSSAVVTWTEMSGVEYWVWVAPSTTLTPDSCVTLLACTVHRAVTSPFLLLGLLNGTTYSLVITGRTGGDPVGPSSPSIAFVPNLAGSIWNANKPLPVDALRAVSYTGAAALATSSTSYFVAVGTGGSLFASSDSITWNAVSSTVSTDLNAVLYGDGRFVAVGNSGTIIASSDGVSYAKVASTTTNNLYAIAVSIASSTMAALGAGGKIVSSNDGLNWTTQSSPTTNDVYGATFANGIFVAVGAHGTLLESPDGATWRVVASPTTSDLRSVTFGPALFVAVGDNGTVVTSPDGLTWTAQAPIGSSNLNGVIFGSQFVAVGSGGSIFTSTDGINWKAAASGTANDLYSVTFSPGVTTTTNINVGYIAVGAGGVNLTAF